MEKETLEIRPPQNDGEIAAAVAVLAGTDPWKTLGMDAGMIEKGIRDPWNDTFLVLHDREVVGVAVIQMNGACTGYLKNLAVKENWRNQHVGSLLMDFIEKRIFSVHPNVFLCVSSFNEAAKRFYLRRGYHEIGVLTDYLIEGYDEVFMRKTRGPILRNKTNE